jgi:hypothetical protein
MISVRDEDFVYRRFVIEVQFSNVDMTRYFVSQQCRAGDTLIIRASGPLRERPES